MEKRTAHYPLAAIKAAIAARGRDCFTVSALQGLATLGLELDAALAALAALERRHLFKSMTTHADHRIWQDVYHCPTPAGAAYVKLTLIEATPDNPTPRVVISFKPLEDTP